MPLTDTSCKNAVSPLKPTKLSDGGGLFLLVQPSGGKLWRLAYRFDGKQKTLALGKYPIIGLKEARRRRDLAKEQLAHGVDPGEQKKKDKRLARLAAANHFQAVATEWFEARAIGWSEAYSSRLWSRMEADLFPKLGTRPVREIEPPELLDAIRSIERRGAIVLARRMLQISGQVFRYAVAIGLATRDPSQDIRGALKTAPPKKHRASLKSVELADFFAKLSTYDGDRTTVLALKLIAHTFLRTSEVRFGRWSEFENLDGPMALWRIPAERMKARAEHLVPITNSVRLLLRELKELAGNSPSLLPAPTKNGVISENTLLYALYRMGYHSRATVHGFRGTASTVLNEQGFNRDWIERQLAHVERNDVRAAYNSAEWLSDRREMLEWWSAFLEKNGS
ncbi:integrase arm-type DNA-binding domain-containing protein [Aminobacter sp. BA135]|uniref:tyrosine-type recombinase/integrase n=1 Tax=Aminobacter sp. BA135 TaxID=537596 RepID=UPI003D7BA256